MLKNGNYFELCGQLTTLVFKKVLKHKEEGQTPDFRKQVGYEIYLLPSKESKYTIEITQDEEKIDYQHIETLRPEVSHFFIFHFF